MYLSIVSHHHPPHHSAFFVFPSTTQNSWNNFSRRCQDVLSAEILVHGIFCAVKFFSFALCSLLPTYTSLLSVFSGLIERIAIILPNKNCSSNVVLTTISTEKALAGTALDFSEKKLSQKILAKCLMRKFSNKSRKKTMKSRAGTHKSPWIDTGARLLANLPFRNVNEEHKI